MALQNFISNYQFYIGDIITIAGKYYLCKKTHISTNTFDGEVDCWGELLDDFNTSSWIPKIGSVGGTVDDIHVNRSIFWIDDYKNRINFIVDFNCNLSNKVSSIVFTLPMEPRKELQFLSTGICNSSNGHSIITAKLDYQNGGIIKTFDGRNFIKGESNLILTGFYGAT